jgi:hypothetical protein
MLPVQFEPDTLDRRRLLRSAAGFIVFSGLPLLASGASAAAAAGRPKYPPAARRTLRVPEDYATLPAAYAAARPGDHISLVGGTYKGNLTLNRAGQTGSPIVIRSRTAIGATLSGQITVTGDHNWLYEIRTAWQATEEGPAAINVKANHCTITRCWVDSNRGVYVYKDGYYNVAIGWNRFTGRNFTGAALSHIFVELPSDREFKTPEAGPNNIFIYRNFFWDSSSRAAEDHVIYFGGSKYIDNVGRMLETYVEYNLIHADTKRARGLYIKRGIDLNYNQMDCGGNFGFRHGAGGRCWGNRANATMVGFNGGGRGQGHDIRGNVFTRELRLHCGATSPGDNLYQAAHDALLVGNVASRIVVGYKRPDHAFSAAEGGKVERARVYLAGRMPAADVVRDPRYCNMATSAAPRSTGGDYTIPVPVKLTQSDVGLEAPNQASTLRTAAA